MKSIVLLLFLLISSGPSIQSDKNQPGFHDLPLSITASKKDNMDAPAAMILSGDGGWYKFEQSIADQLSMAGVPVIGLDTRKYFWTRRTPEETASDMSDCLNHYNAQWGRKRIIFIGYSLGAELVPFMISRLPGEIKSKVSMFILLSPEANTDFQVHITDMLGVGNKHNTYRVLDEIGKIENIPSLIIFGADEKSDVPRLLESMHVNVVIIPGDHHYNHDTSLIVKTMKDHNAF